MLPSTWTYQDNKENLVLISGTCPFTINKVHQVTSKNILRSWLNLPWQVYNWKQQYNVDIHLSLAHTVPPTRNEIIEHFKITNP